MPQCHICPWNVAEKIKSGELDPEDWESLPCSSCELSTAPYNHGQIHVSFDEMPEAEQKKIHYDRMDAACLSNGSPCIVDALKSILMEFVRMDEKTRNIVCGKIRGESLTIISEREEISNAACSKRYSKAVAKFPVLQAAASLGKKPWNHGKKMGHPWNYGVKMETG